jgi:hypothetical protein
MSANYGYSCIAPVQFSPFAFVVVVVVVVFVKPGVKIKLIL